MNDFWSYWYFHIPNFILAAIMYTLLGRLVLGLFVPENWDNYIWRAFKLITDPILKLVRFVTPNALTGLVVIVFGVLWIMLIRLVYLVALINYGLAPVAQGS
ncbi:hypothetical protein [Mesorhizobium sp. KR9-304]|uniref:hypothetical protein n=1 Tax=Mesorhizobium sp. KR9-304 TaxID=3156614 RepID=UPI0032B61BD0